MLKKYGDFKVKFKSYYKYKFNFVYESGDTIIVVSVGGCGGSIYRFEVESNIKYTIVNLYPNEVTVFEKGIQTEHYSNY